MRIRHGGVWAAAVVVALGVAGCKSKPADNPAITMETLAVIKPGQTVAPDAATLGSVNGVVKMTGKPPAPVKIDMTMDPACGMSAGGDNNVSEQYAVHNGDLGNVFIYVKEGPKAAFNMPAVSGPVVVMDQKGCRYTPHVIALQKGGSIEFRNSDITMHNIHTMPTAPGSTSIDISQSPKGASQTKQFNQAETMIPVRCNNHPWMNAFVNVSETPFFAVTDADGKFSLKGLPAGEYTLAAVHEKLGEQTMKVSVKALGSVDTKFTFVAK